MVPPAPVFTTAQVLAALLHKLGSPLGAVVNHAHVLGLGGADPSASARDLAAAATRAAQLVEGARRWLDACAPAGAPRDLDVAAALDEARGRLAGRGVPEVAVEAGPCPPVRVAAAALGRILDELLANAAAAAADGARARVHVDGVREGPLVRLRVRDEGPGWSEEEALRGFGLFTTGPRGSQGAGMGLPIVSVTARGAGGSVEAAAAPSGGAAVHVRLPAAS
jgi:two-component system C4-dicarboxylate transport sensor histidine kinase DctB